MCASQLNARVRRTELDGNNGLTARKKRPTRRILSGSSTEPPVFGGLNDGPEVLK